VGQSGVEVHVFSGRSRSVAVLLRVRSTDKRRMLEIPLPAARIEAFDAYGSSVRLSQRNEGLVVDLVSGPIYLVAGPEISAGRFALQLRESTIVAP
jgi:hypothetical protein